MNVVEEQARVVELRHGVRVQSFYDPAHTTRADAPAPVRRWRVRLPDWFDSGSWLHGEHSFTSAEAALAALEDSGTLDAIDAYWKAKSALSAARQSAFTKIMAAHCQRDKTYDEILYARQRAHIAAAAASGERDS